MAALGAFSGKLVLDFLCGGAAAAAPTNRWAGLCVGTPGSNDNAASEMNTLTGYSRLTALFGAAASAAGSASNTAGMTFGPFSSNGSALGCGIWNGSPVNSSNILLQGTLQTARTFAPGDSLVFSPGALTITAV